MRDDLSALVFELQRAGSKVDKAKALARAWRTVRGLSAAERRLLAREVGFDGADDLIEGLAGKGSGVFAPAAVLEALGKMRREEGLSLRGILSGLRDPESRDDLLVRGIDLVADSVVRPEDDSDEGSESNIHDQALELDDDDLFADAGGHFRETETVTVPPLPPAAPEPEPRSVPVPRPAPPPEPQPELGPEPEPVEVAPPAVVDPSSWDELWDEPESELAARSFVGRAERHRISRARAQGKRTEGTVLDRLRAFREAIPGFENATENQIRDALDELPEEWARRRALVALIDADVPNDVGRLLDLIDDLYRAMDRRWCLSVLARRGDLAGADLERALGMISSPAARRRVTSLARRA